MIHRENRSASQPSAGADEHVGDQKRRRERAGLRHRVRIVRREKRRRECFGSTAASI